MYSLPPHQQREFVVITQLMAPCWTKPSEENMLATVISTLLLTTLSKSDASDRMVCSSSVCIPKDYNKLDLPTMQTNEKLKVNMSLFLIDIYQINPKTFTFNLNFVLKLKCHQCRIFKGPLEALPLHVERQRRDGKVWWHWEIGLPRGPCGLPRGPIEGCLVGLV